MGFENQIVLVTGSTRGIGLEIAREFAKAKATVILTGRNQETVDQAVSELTKQGYRADGFSVDVANTANVKEITDKILDKHNRVDILVNNAGVAKDNLLLRMSENDWDEVMAINLKGVFNFTKAVSKPMLKAQKGRIINISSVIGVMGNVGQANYAASKAGIIGFTKSVAKELASRGITVNSIAPGYIDTDMTQKLSEKIQHNILNQIPMKTFGRPSDIALACLFLASESANYITGQTLVIDGGMAL